MPKTDVKSKVKVHDLPVSRPSNSTSVVIKQDIVYHKQSLHKSGVWKAKSENSSVENVKISNELPNQSSGQWVEFIMSDESGKPKTVKAWVPNLN